MSHLILRLEAPMMSFGGEVVDQNGPTVFFPPLSMLTGLLGHALGYRSVDAGLLQDLQERIVFAARIEREPAGRRPSMDFQTVRLGAKDRGWTTRGEPEGRRGDVRTFDSPHLRYRQYLSDASVTVALRLLNPEEHPILQEIGSALELPAHPLFIGRKPFVPSVPIYAGYAPGDTALEALMKVPALTDPPPRQAVRTMWPESEGSDQVTEFHRTTLMDQRNWWSRLHGGQRVVCQGMVAITETYDPSDE